MRTGAVVVAAGLSSRMGEFKPLLPLGNTTIIGHVVDTLQAFGASPIIVVTGREAETLKASLSSRRVECVHNPDFASTDMFRSACLGFEAVGGRADSIFFLPVDSPLFSPQCLQALCDRMQQTACGVARPAFGGRCGHPILLDTKLLPALCAFRGDGGLRRAIEQTGCTDEWVAVSEPAMLLDADTPEDYARIVAAFNQHE